MTKEEATKRRTELEQEFQNTLIRVGFLQGQIALLKELEQPPPPEIKP